MKGVMPGAENGFNLLKQTTPRARARGLRDDSPLVLFLYYKLD
jgi:hypothetical protein